MTGPLPIEPLTRARFAPFGEVIESAGSHQYPINDGTATRFHALARVEVGAGGRAILSIFRAQARILPIRLTLLERHPLGSQAFMPLSGQDWLVVVADRPTPDALRCFHAHGTQGVQYAPGVWHHPLLVIGTAQDFLVVDRDGPGLNLEEAILPGERSIALPADWASGARP